jgi:hypothetical protein
LTRVLNCSSPACTCTNDGCAFACICGHIAPPWQCMPRQLLMHTSS